MKKYQNVGQKYGSYSGIGYIDLQTCTASMSLEPICLISTF